MSFPHGVIYFQQENAKVLPRLNIYYNINIINNFCNITLIQDFRNDTGQDRQVYYAMPTDPEFCISKMTVKYQGKDAIPAVIVPLTVAEQKYQKFLQGQSENQNVILCKYNSVSKGIMEIKIGKMLKKNNVSITIQLITHLEPYIEEQWILRIPSYIGPKWNINQQSQVQYVNYPWEKKKFQVDLRASYELVSYDYFNHQLTRDIRSSRNWFFKYEGDYSNNQDFIFSYKHRQFGRPQCSLGDQCLVLTLFQQCSKEKSRKMQQIYFVIDRSGSMQGNRLEQAKKAVNILLESLPQPLETKNQIQRGGVNFNIIHFGSDFTIYSPNNLIPNDQIIVNAKAWVTQIQSSGGTNINSPLQELYRRISFARNSNHKQRLMNRNIIVLTDGQVSDIELVCQIIKRLRNQLHTYVHFIGIGESKGSIDLIKQGSQMGEGGHLMLYSKHQIHLGRQMSSMLDKITGDLIGQLQIYPVNAVDIFTAQNTYPNILQRRKKKFRNKGVLNIYYRFDQRFQGEVRDLQIVIRYKNFGENINVEQLLEIDNLIGAGFVNSDTFKKYSAFHQMNELEREENINKEQIVRISTNFQILSKRTALIVEIPKPKNLPGGASQKYVLRIGNSMSIKQIKQLISDKMDPNSENQIGFYTQTGLKVEDQVLMKSMFKPSNKIKQQHKLQIEVYSVDTARIVSVDEKLVSHQVNIRRIQKTKKKDKQNPEQQNFRRNSMAVIPQRITEEATMQYIIDIMKQQLLKEFKVNGKIPYNKLILEEYQLLGEYEKYLKKYLDEDQAMTITIYQYIRRVCRGDLRQLKMIVRKMLIYVRNNQNEIKILSQFYFAENLKCLDISLQNGNKTATVNTTTKSCLAVITTTPLNNISNVFMVKIKLSPNYMFSIGIGSEISRQFLQKNHQHIDSVLMHKQTYWISQNINSIRATVTSAESELVQKNLTWKIQDNEILIIELDRKNKKVQFSISNKQDEQKYSFPLLIQAKSYYPIVLMKDINQKVQIQHVPYRPSTKTKNLL